ncbi:unnamed protein product [Paramecium sonneborni]|uniref:Uncharacterized protein n=1 Tax=Paramecium sonneborni TaxID=65129 RepID=A0A8S1PQS8_9CILI|nr:unnamed protein product [Paramecium sonneborni]
MKLTINQLQIEFVANKIVPSEREMKFIPQKQNSDPQATNVYDCNKYLVLFFGQKFSFHQKKNNMINEKNDLKNKLYGTTVKCPDLQNVT